MKFFMRIWLPLTDARIVRREVKGAQQFRQSTLILMPLAIYFNTN